MLCLEVGDEMRGINLFSSHFEEISLGKKRPAQMMFIILGCQGLDGMLPSSYWVWLSVLEDPFIALRVFFICFFVVVQSDH